MRIILQIPLPCGGGALPRMEAWLARGPDCPLGINLRAPDSISSGIDYYIEFRSTADTVQLASDLPAQAASSHPDSLV